MKRGNTEIETLRLNGWGVGDILEGEDHGKTARIWITGLGQERFLCRWQYQGSEQWATESGSATLRCREWRRVFVGNGEG